MTGAAPQVPDATEIESGHVWPPVKGRGAIAFATDGPFSVPDVVRPWAPIGALELLGDSGWILHTTDRWTFEREPDARRRLLTLVRGLLARAPSIPDGRALAVVKDGDVWRLWLVTQRIPSVLDALLAAFSEVNVSRVISIVARTLQGMQERGTTVPVSAGLSGLTIHDGRFGVLSLDETDGEPQVEARDPIAELFDLVDRHAHADPALGRWLDTDGIQLLSRARGQAVHP